MGEKVKVYVKRLCESARMPERAHSNDAGADVFATSVVSNCSGCTDVAGKHVVSYGTGIAFAIDDSHWIDLRPRSSIYKTGLTLSNGVGIIDSGYRGEEIGRAHV